MQVGIKFQVTAKSVRDDDDKHSNAELPVYPLLDDVSTKCWQVIDEVAVALEDAPKLSGHCKDDACVGNVRKDCLLIFQPVECGPIPTTGAESRFASVVTTFFLTARGIYFASQSRCPAIRHLCKILTYCHPSLRSIPEIS
jgi:hypothetical protein